MPYDELSTTLSIRVLDADWTGVNVVGVFGAASGLLGLPGFYMVQAQRLGFGGLVAFLVTLLGSALLLGPMLWDTVIWLPLARHDPSILDFTGPIYSSAAFVPFFVSAGLLWAAGYASLAWKTSRAAILPRVPCWLVAVGAPLFGLGSLLGTAQAIPRSNGITLFSIGLVWIGFAMRRLPEVLQETPGPSPTVTEGC